MQKGVYHAGRKQNGFAAVRIRTHVRNAAALHVFAHPASSVRVKQRSKRGRPAFGRAPDILRRSDPRGPEMFLTGFRLPFVGRADAPDLADAAVVNAGHFEGFAAPVEHEVASREVAHSSPACRRQHLCSKRLRLSRAGRSDDERVPFRMREGLEEVILFLAHAVYPGLSLFPDGFVFLFKAASGFQRMQNEIRMVLQKEQLSCAAQHRFFRLLIVDAQNVVNLLRVPRLPEKASAEPHVIAVRRIAADLAKIVKGSRRRRLSDQAQLRAHEPQPRHQGLRCERCAAARHPQKRSRRKVADRRIDRIAQCTCAPPAGRLHFKIRPPRIFIIGGADRVLHIRASIPIFSLSFLMSASLAAL